MRRLVPIIAAACFAPAPALADDMTLLGVGVGGRTSAPATCPANGSTCMLAPLMVWNQGASNPSTSATDYIPGLPLGSINASYQTIQTRAYTPIAVAGTLSNLAVQAQTSPSPGNYGFTLFHGSGTTESSTSLGCNSTNGNAISSTAICNISNPVTVAPGDTFSFQIVPSGTPAASQFDVSALFTSTVGQEAPLFAGSSNTSATTTPTGATSYYGFGHQVVGTSNENLVSSMMPNAGTIDRLYVYASSLPGASNNWTVTVNHETAGNCGGGSVSPTSLSVTVSASQIPSDLTPGHAFTVAPGDCISLSATVTVGGAAVPSPTYISASVRFQPVVTNAYPLFADGTTLTLTASTTKFINAAGYVLANGSATDPPVNGVTPGGFSSSMTFGPLYALQSATPGSSSSFTRTFGF
jgi:hypothetical protein